MANTIRTKSELLSIFADNITGDITPQDMRDFVVSNQVAETQVESSAGASISELSDTFFAEALATDATLPTTAAYGNRLLIVANGSGGVFTLNANGGDTINGGASITIDDEQFAQVTPDGSNWVVIVNTSGNGVPAHTHIKADITDFSDSDYATAAQGSTADSATQPLDNISTLTNDAGYLTSVPTPIFGSEFQTSEKTADQTTSSTSFQQYQRMTTPSLPAGVYKIEFLSLWTSGSSSRSIANRVQVNDSITLFGGESFNKEGKDGNSNQRENFGGSDYYTHAGGVLDIDVDFRRSQGGGTVTMRYSNISIHRVS